VRWIIGTGKDIAVDSSQVRARRDYIQQVTGAEVSAWSVMQVNGQVRKKYLYCTSNDGIDGTFITAHIEDVYQLCSVREIHIGKFVVANTCMLKRMNGKKLLSNLRSFNRDIELWFAKQELSLDGNVLWQSTTLNNIGGFEFQTSKSERKLFVNRRKGLMEAIGASFDRVSPVILLGD
jgi:hypothetical protein